MQYQKPEDFYAVYDTHRTYVRAEVRKKHLAEFGRNLWTPGEFQKTHRVLEVGCGTGLFLAFLAAKGVTDFTGIEMDPKAKDFMPAPIASRVQTTTPEAFLAAHDGARFDRIVLLDLFEHFSMFEGVEVLRSLSKILADDGRIIMRVPNCASPWGWQYQLGDLTHKAAYTPGSVGHIAMAAGLRCKMTRPYSRGSAFRRLTTRVIEGTLNRLLTDPPPIWTANFVAVLAKP